MSFEEGQDVVYEGICDGDGLAPGDAGTIVVMTGSGAWVSWSSGALTGCMRLVWLDDLEPATETRQETP